MVDRYQPQLSAFALTVDEQKTLDEALATEDPWGWKPGKPKSTILKNIKKKIREFHLTRHGGKCCYCRKNLHGEGPFMTDREHILPKSENDYKLFSYAIWNLGIACKRCNMEYKKTKIDFIVNQTDATQYMESENYRFIHPNFDLYREHISRAVQESDECVVVKYTVISESLKGAYTYDYFNLRGLEVDTFDLAQGVHVNHDLGDVALEVRALATSLGQ